MKVYAYGAMLVRFLYREHRLLIVIVSYVQYFTAEVLNILVVSILAVVLE